MVNNVKDIDTNLSNAVKELDNIKQDVKDGNVKWIGMVYKDCNENDIKFLYWSDDLAEDMPPMIGGIEIAKNALMYIMNEPE